MPRESTANGDGNFHKAKLNRNPRAAAVDVTMDVDVVVHAAVDVATTSIASNGNGNGNGTAADRIALDRIGSAELCRDVIYFVPEPKSKCKTPERRGGLLGLRTQDGGLAVPCPN
ncbi:GM11906 [Drosophila sechellia]|uniref:GM11906 n=1 Tax=Drosophila sechellia TaxID=7238 RepID=B4IH95_DROSE|nr:GM11906 [Drosophila sechellia]